MLRNYEFSEDQNYLTVGAGFKWGEIYTLTKSVGKFIVGGGDKTVGVGGYVQGGGHSILSTNYNSFFLFESNVTS